MPADFLVANFLPANFAEALPFILLALALLVALWVIIRASRKTKVIGETKGDVLDEGAGPAPRNQALIDAQPSAVEDESVALKSTIAEAVPVAEPATEPAAEPVAASAPEPVAAPAPAPSGSDDLKRIKGLGPKLVTILAEQGVTSFAQIAAWDEADIARVDAGLGRFKGRITRDKWVEQAKLLAADDEAGFSATFGNNG